MSYLLAIVSDDFVRDPCIEIERYRERKERLLPAAVLSPVSLQATSDEATFQSLKHEGGLQLEINVRLYI